MKQERFQTLSDAKIDQKAFLSAAKRALSTATSRLTWDMFAVRVGVEPRALKTYRMPADSSDYRTMPRLLIEKIEVMLAEMRAASTQPSSLLNLPPFLVPVIPSPEQEAPSPAPADRLKLLPQSLAALVIRQAKQVFMGGGATMVSGVDRYWGGVSGLGDEDRRAMALVSRARLSLGLPDVGAEIHELLAHCMQPLGEWLPISAVKEAGLNAVRLIDTEDRMPTLEAEEMSAGYGGMTSLLEEQVFAAFQDSLSKHSTKDADEFYTAVRTFVVRNPVVTRKQLLKFMTELPAAVWACVEQQFYEQLPGSLVPGGTVTLCAHCNNVMAQRAGGLYCTTAACAAVHSVKLGRELPANDLMRLNRSLRKYWLEPGIDEIRLAALLTASGLVVRIYPNRDQVDLDLGEGSDVGIDLKAYSSPELLGERLRRRPGGLRNYKKQLLVIPDWLVRKVPNYVERLRSCLADSTIRAISMSDAVSELCDA